MLLSMGTDLATMFHDLSPVANALNTLLLLMAAHLIVIGFVIDEDVTGDRFVCTNIAFGIVPSVLKRKDEATTTQSFLPPPVPILRLQQALVQYGV